MARKLTAHLHFDLEKQSGMCKELEKRLLQLQDKSSQNKFADTVAAKEWLDGEAGMYKPLLRIMPSKKKYGWKSQTWLWP